MLVSDLLHSCANDRVAEAAVSSIGGDFASRIQDQAEDGGVSVGRFAAMIVREFAQGATERDWRDLTSAVRGQDHPVLAGLQLILTRHAPTLQVHGRGADLTGYRGIRAATLAAAAA